MSHKYVFRGQYIKTMVIHIKHKNGIEWIDTTFIVIIFYAQKFCLIA